MAPSTHPKRIPYLKTLRWDSQALCERDWDESCFLTCGERWCWNLSSQLLLYCDILHSNFPYLTESDASLISAAPLQTLPPFMYRWVLCYVICTVSGWNRNRTAYEFYTLWTQSFGCPEVTCFQTGPNVEQESTHWNCSMHVCVWRNVRNYSVLLCHAKMEKVRKERFWSRRRQENKVLK